MKKDDKEYNDEVFISEKKMQFLSKFDNELYNDDSNIVYKLVNVKRIELPNKGENWEIFEDKKLVHVINGLRLTKSEKAVLRTIEGIKLIMDEYKKGNKSIINLKNKIKEIK